MTDQNQPLIQSTVGDELVVVDPSNGSAYTLRDGDTQRRFLSADSDVSRRIVLRGGALLGAGAVVAVALPMAAAAASTTPGTGGGGPVENPGDGITRTGLIYLETNNNDPRGTQPTPTTVHGNFTATLYDGTGTHDRGLFYTVNLTNVANGSYILNDRILNAGQLANPGVVPFIITNGSGSFSSGLNYENISLFGFKLQFDAYIPTGVPGDNTDAGYVNGTPIYISEVVSYN